MTDTTTRTLPDYLARLGARPTAILGEVVPAHFGTPEAEARAALESVGLYHFPPMSVVSATGGDHREYMNRRLSQKTDDLVAGDARRAALLGADGRMQADMEVLARAEDTLLISTPATGAEALAELMERYVFTEDAAFKPLAGIGVALMALVGPRVPEALEALGVRPPPAQRRFASLRLANRETLHWRSELVGGGIALMVLGEAGAVWSLLLDTARRLGGGPIGGAAMDLVRVRAGAAWWGVDVAEGAMPLDANLTSAIHDNKGCYPGQEAIARTLNLGHPARQLVAIAWDSGVAAPVAGTVLRCGRTEAGRVSTSATDPRTSRALSLATVKWQFREEGTEFAHDGGAGLSVPLPVGD